MVVNVSFDGTTEERYDYVIMKVVARRGDKREVIEVEIDFEHARVKLNTAHDEMVRFHDCTMEQALLRLAACSKALAIAADLLQNAGVWAPNDGAPDTTSAPPDVASEPWNIGAEKLREYGVISTEEQERFQAAVRAVFAKKEKSEAEEREKGFFNVQAGDNEFLTKRLNEIIAEKRREAAKTGNVPKPRHVWKTPDGSMGWHY